MNAFQRSLEILKMSLDVMKKDKELFLFPIVGGIFSILFVITMIFPIIIVAPTEETIGKGLPFYLAIFLIYFGLAIIATFFNTCVVYTVKTRFDGRNATFWDSIKFAFSKIHLILAWGAISATVGLILRILDEIADRMGGIGEIIIHILTSILGAVWSIITLFVIPAMVYHNVGPIDAIKKSTAALKHTWGESLIRYYGLGLIQIILIVIGIVLGIVFGILTIGIPFVFYTVILLTIIYLVTVIVFFNIANTIFNTALYVYADTGKAPHAYNNEVIKNAFAKKEKNE
jgi:hypothetical protein